MWDSSLISKLKSAADAFDREGASQVVQDLVEQLRAGQFVPALEQQKAAFDHLRSARWFALMQGLGGALVATGKATHRAKRQYAQALIEQGLLDDAIEIAQGLVADPATPVGEKAEAGGLVGRAHKQLYVDRFAILGPARRSVLEASISAYYDVYVSNRAEFTWQGINAVAMLLRARRDKISVVEPESPEKMAEAILKAAGESTAHWDMATAAEACVALAMPDPNSPYWTSALAYLEKYVKSEGLDAFSCASTLRQLKQVWQIREGGTGGELLTMLQPAVLAGPAASGPVLQRLGAGLSLAAGELNAASTRTRAQNENLERVFGGVGPRSFAWYSEGMARARAVARIETSLGKGFGTGFLVKAASLFTAMAGSDELVLVTNAHVLGHTDPLALRPGDARVRWEAVDTARRLGVREILFESPEGELDVTVARLDAAVTGVEACPLAPREEPTFDAGRARQLYVIGHPDGGTLTISIDDNLQVGWKAPKLHYRTPTNPGSSGSPVYDDQWRVVAVHHAGSDSMPRLDGQSGTYQANEGMWIHAVLDAIAQKEKNGAGLESASPAVRPAFRRSVFISYAHADADWLERLMIHLKPLTRATSLDVWDDRKIAAGSNWSGEIERQLDSACVAILLVSPNFVASDFIYGTELPRLLQASSHRGLSIIPIAISQSSYELIPDLAALQFANDPKRPLAELPKATCDAALTDIVKKIAGVLDLTRVSNQFRAMDAVSFKDTGLGGTKGSEAGLSGMGARFVQTSDGVAIDTGFGTVPVVSLQKVEAMGEQERQLIASYDVTIRTYFDRWTELYPQRSARDMVLRERVRVELEHLRADLCKELNLLLDFYCQLGAPLQDHYMAIRHVCAS